MSDNNNRQGTDGFALPVVLSAGLLIVAMLSIAIKQSSNNNFNSRIRLLSSLTNSALESISNEYRALLNDVSNSYYLSYFWLVNGCSANNRATPTNCPKTLGTLVSPTGIQNPSETYWDDAPFCLGSNNCFGRQIAPSCDLINPNPGQGLTGSYIPWLQLKSSLDPVFNSVKSLSGSQVNASSYAPYGNVNSYSTVGSIELGGRSQLDFSGLIKQGAIIKGERRARVSMEIERSLPYKGFAFISAGIAQADLNSIHLSNLKTVNPSGGAAKGIIQLRKNMSVRSNPLSCTRPTKIFHYISSNTSNYSFPTKGNGGLLIHSTHWPTSSKLPSNAPGAAPQNLIVRGNLKESIGSSTQERKFTYRNLFILRGSTYTIETSDTSPVTIQLTDSLDVLPGARLCHVSANSSVCGSGKPQNLTIISTFKDYTNTSYTPNPSHTGCSVPDPNEGTGEVYSERDKDLSRAGATFTFRSTGRPSSQEKLSAFIYGKDLTFTSAGVHRGNYGTYLLDTNDTRYNLRSSALIVHRGRLAVTNLTGTNDKRVWDLLGPSKSRFLINGDSSRSIVNRMSHDDHMLDGHKVLAVARYSYWGQYNTRFFYTPQYIAVTYNWRNNTFRIWDAVVRRSPSGGSTSSNSNGLLQITLPSGGSSSINSLWGRIPRQFSASSLNSYSNPLKILYSLSFTKPGTYEQNPVRRYSGAVWSRNVCFSRNWKYGDYLRDQYWEFNPDFVDKLVDRYDSTFRMGYAVYKSRYIRSWDILRDFYN